METQDVSQPVEIAGLRKSFGDVTALDDVDFEVGQGQVHGLLGRNGAGKSTLLRVIFGLVRPDAGRVLIFGRDHLTSGPALALEGVAGFVDRPHFYPYLTARRSLRMLSAIDGLDAAGGIDPILDRVGLSHARDRRVRGWSTGMLQRLGIAAALMRSPRLLVLDEPTEGLDPAASAELIEIVRSLATDGVSVIFSSHNIEEVDSVCDGVTVLSHGRVMRSGSIEDLRAESPAGSHRMLTSDGAGAVRIALAFPVTLTEHVRGGFRVEAEPAALHGFVCELGRQDVSVQLLEQDVAPLSALFLALTGEPES